MDEKLFKEISAYIYSYNKIPIWLIDNGNTIYSSINDNILRDDAQDFFNNFSNDTLDLKFFNELEYFASVPIKLSNQSYQLIIGPGFLSHPISVGYKGQLSIDYLVKNENIQELLLVIPTTSFEEFANYLCLLVKLINGRDLSNEIIKNKFLKSNVLTITNQLDSQLTQYLFQVRENEISPYSPEVEKKIMNMVKQGDVEGVKKINVRFAIDSPKSHPKYLFKIVALVTVATRAVLECGVDPDEAYGLSDLYLNSLSNTQNDYQVYEIAKNILPHFATLTRKQIPLEQPLYSVHLYKAIKYIKQHLHYPLSLEIVAKELGINPKYLSHLFVNEMHEKFTHYVNKLRIKEAKELLANTNYSIVDIATSLSFSSESYFICIFSKIEGITPKKYREKIFSKY